MIGRRVQGMQVQDYGSNYDAGGFFDDFVERYEQQRALTIEDVLEDIEGKLYNPDIISIGTEGDKGVVDSNPKALEEDYPRHFDGVGYAAHHDGVDDAELKAWRNQYPYLRVTGIGIQTGEDEEPLPIAVPPVDIPTSVTSLSAASAGSESELMIVGLRLTISEGSVSLLGCADEEVFEEHGELVEYFAFDNREDIPSSSTAVHAAPLSAAAGRSCSPANSYRAEVINNLFDAVWPEVVESLDPLIRRVLRLAAAMPPATPMAIHDEDYGGNFDQADEDGGVSAW